MKFGQIVIGINLLMDHQASGAPHYLATYEIPKNARPTGELASNAPFEVRFPMAYPRFQPTAREYIIKNHGFDPDAVSHRELVQASTPESPFHFIGPKVTVPPPVEVAPIKSQGIIITPNTPIGMGIGPEVTVPPPVEVVPIKSQGIIITPNTPIGMGIGPEVTVPPPVEVVPIKSQGIIITPNTPIGMGIGPEVTVPPPVEVAPIKPPGIIITSNTPIGMGIGPEVLGAPNVAPGPTKAPGNIPENHKMVSNVHESIVHGEDQYADLTPPQLVGIVGGSIAFAAGASTVLLQFGRLGYRAYLKYGRKKDIPIIPENYTKAWNYLKSKMQRTTIPESKPSDLEMGKSEAGPSIPKVDKSPPPPDTIENTSNQVKV